MAPRVTQPPTNGHGKRSAQPLPPPIPRLRGLEAPEPRCRVGLSRLLCHGRFAYVGLGLSPTYRGRYTNIAAAMFRSPRLRGGQKGVVSEGFSSPGYLGSTGPPMLLHAKHMSHPAGMYAHVVVHPVVLLPPHVHVGGTVVRRGLCVGRAAVSAALDRDAWLVHSARTPGSLSWRPSCGTWDSHDLSAYGGRDRVWFASWLARGLVWDPEDCVACLATSVLAAHVPPLCLLKWLMGCPFFTSRQDERLGLLFMES